MACNVRRMSGIMLPSPFLKVAGVCLLVIGLYDTNLYHYALTRSEDTFDFFGRRLAPGHPLVKIGFIVVLAFYYLVGTLMVIFG